MWFLLLLSTIIGLTWRNNKKEGKRMSPCCSRCGKARRCGSGRILPCPPCRRRVQKSRFVRAFSHEKCCMPTGCMNQVAEVSGGEFRLRVDARAAVQTRLGRATGGRAELAHIHTRVACASFHAKPSSHTHTRPVQCAKVAAAACGCEQATGSERGREA